MALVYSRAMTRSAVYACITLCVLAWVTASQVLARELAIAAAADLKYALTEVVEQFRASQPDARIEVIYGSSGKFYTQIKNGAPFDLYLSADIEYARRLEREGLAAYPARTFAVGRLVLWSHRPELARTALKDLPRAGLRRFAIANPQHAPYGVRAREALKHQGVWEALQSRLVLGENVAHTAQFVDSGAADAGIVALSLVLSPTLAGKGAWTLIPEGWHTPLEQGVLVTRRAAGNRLAREFADSLMAEPARTILRRYGFALPGEGGR